MSASTRPLGRAGLQAERTALAWERMALAMVVNGVLLLVRNAGSIGGSAVVGVIAAVALTVSVAVAALGAVRGRRIRRLPAAVKPSGSALSFCGMTVASLGICVLAIAASRWGGW